MRAIRFLMVGVLALGTASAASAAHHEELMAEVQAFGDAVQAAMIADDVDAMLAMYVDDAISLPNYAPRMDGVEAFRAHHEQMTAAGMKIVSFESDPTEVWAAGDQVIEIGTFEIQLEMPGMPQPVDDHGKYMTVYVRDADGALKIKAETWNTDVNPMEMMGGDMMEGHGGHEGHGAPMGAENGSDSDSESDSDSDSESDSDSDSESDSDSDSEDDPGDG